MFGMRRNIIHQAVVRLFLLLSALIAGVDAAYPQIGIKQLAVKPIEPDSADLQYYGKKNFWRPAAEVVGLNTTVWLYDRFLLKAPGAYINFASIKRNLTSGFKWDSDQLGTNTFLHPYHGSLYFNAGRSNGYNFWQSECFAIAGSLMWELFMECEYPSTNDFIATPIGGAVVGETTFRASDAVLDDRTTGWERFGREAAGFIISPMRGLNRIFTGQAWRTRATSGHYFGTPPIGVRLSLGPKMLICRNGISAAEWGASLQLDLEYGYRFQPTVKPYDYFTVKAELQAMKNQPLLSHVSIKGRLLGRNIHEGKKASASVGFYQHFDYFDSDTISSLKKVPYKLGIPASLGAGVMYRYNPGNVWNFDAYAHANLVILGGILSDHYTTNKRNYNWASGFSVKGGVNWVFNRRHSALTVNHEFYRLFTWHGYKPGLDLAQADYRTLNVMGDKSQSSFNVTTVRFDTRIWRNIYASFVFDGYLRKTHYRDYPDHSSYSCTLRAMLSYKF